MRSRDLAVLLLGVVFGVAINAAMSDGMRLEAGYGVAKAAKPTDGTWYQDELEHHLHLKDTSWSIGISGETPLKDLRWATRYENLGKFATRAIANVDSNDDASLRGKKNADPRRAQCQVEFAEDCHDNWHGEGSLYGLVAALGAEPFKLGPVRIGLEAGAFFYRATWRERIRPIDCPGNQCWEMQIDKRTGWQVGPEVGLTARWDWLYVAARRFGAPEKITAGFAGPVRQFEIGFSIPL